MRPSPNRRNLCHKGVTCARYAEFPMGISALTVAAYLLVGGLCGVWFWRVIRSTGHRANVALVIVSAAFGALWPVMMPGVTVYRWMLRRPIESREDVTATR